MTKYLITGGLAFLLSFMITPWVRWIAQRFGVLDRPGLRKIHRKPVPRLGGVAVFLSFQLILGILTWASASWPGFGWGNLGFDWRLTLIGLAVLALGVLDDFRSLNPWWKFCTQICVALTVFFIGYRIDSISYPFSEGFFSLGALSLPITVIWVVGVTNAFNLIDGLDGLASGVALIASLTLFAVSVVSQNVSMALVTASLGGCLIGFLWYNFYPARIFLGDSGSLILGFYLSVLSISSSQKGATAIAISVPILVLGVPLIDTLIATVRRLLGSILVVGPMVGQEQFSFGRSKLRIFSADRGHIHHRLMELGLTHRGAVFVLYGAAMGFGMAAILSYLLRDPRSGLVVVAIAISSCIGISKLNYPEFKVFRGGMLLPLFSLPVVTRRFFHAFVDLCFIAGAYYGALFIVTGGRVEGPLRSFFFSTVPLVLLLKLVLFSLCGMYKGAYRYVGVSDLLKILWALLLGTAVTLGMIYLWENTSGVLGPIIPFILLDFYLLTTLVLVARISYRVLNHLFQANGQNGRKVLIVGTPMSSLQALHKIIQDCDLNLKPIGFLVTEKQLRERTLEGFPVLGGPEDIEKVLDTSKVDKILIANHGRELDTFELICSSCARRGIPILQFRSEFEILEEPPRGELKVTQSFAESGPIG